MLRWPSMPLLLVMASIVFAFAEREASAAKPPNILFLFTDDHAAHSMSCYGSKINKTPNLDRIANNGVRFDRCYVTNSLCGPSRATILTGKHSHLNGFKQNGDRFDGSQVTFPKLLQQGGYQTAVIGKWHLETDPTGFDHWDILVGQGPYYNPPMIANGQRVKREGYTTEIIGDLAMEWLNTRRDPNKPWLMMCQHKAPHREWQPGPKYFDLYKNETIPEPPTLFLDHSQLGTPSKVQTLSIAKDMTELDLKLTPPKNLTPAQAEVWHKAYDEENEAFRKANLTGNELVRWKYQRYIKDYLRCVAAVDDQVGRLLDWVEKSGEADNTIIVYSSDQGFFLGDHGWFDKRFMYEPCYRTPLLMMWPGKTKPGSVNKDLVSNLDFAQTFLQAAGVKADPSMQGASLIPLLEGSTPADWRKSLYYHYYEYPGVHDVHRHIGVKTARYKLLHYYHLGEWEMFDAETDPLDTKNIYNDPAYAEARKELEKELARLKQHYQDPDDPKPEPKPNAQPKAKAKAQKS